MIFDFQ